MNTTRNTLSVRWLYLAAGTVAMLFAGIIYAWSILKAPFAGEFGWKPAQLALNFTLTMCFFCTGGLIGAKLTSCLGRRWTLVIAAVLAACGFICTSFLSGVSLLPLYICYGVMAGAGIGIAYNVIISTVSAWFPDRKGLCSGCLMMGFGASALALGNLAAAFMENTAFGWRNTFILLGICLGIVLLVAAVILKMPDGSIAFPISKTAAVTGGREDFTTRQMLCRPSFWLVFFHLLGLAAVGSSVISFARDLCLSAGASLGLATTLVGILSVFNGLGRIATGALFDRIGQKKTMVVSNVTAIAAAGVILLAVLCHNLPLCILGLCVTGLSYGACPTVSAAFTAAFYGQKHFSTNLAVMNFHMMLSSFVATLCSSLLTASGGYIAPFILLLGLTVFSFILNLCIRKP